MILWGKKASPLLEQAKLLCYNYTTTEFQDMAIGERERKAEWAAVLHR